jgi:hypothetical protein
MTTKPTDTHNHMPADQPLALRLSEGLGVTRFAPSVVVDGRTVQPEGWMWVLSFALAGGRAGAYIANSQVSPRYNANGRTITAVVTTASTGGGAGRTRVLVVYARMEAAKATAATKA